MIPGVWAFSGWSARLRTLAQRIGRRWFFTIAVYYVLFTLITFLVMLPLDYYAGFVRQHAYGMSNQSLLKWTEDTLIQLALNLLAGCTAALDSLRLLARAPRRWWLYTGLLVPPLLVLVMLILPIWIEPLFNHFGPIKDRRLEEKIVALRGGRGSSTAASSRSTRASTPRPKTPTSRAFSARSGSCSGIRSWPASTKRS